MPNLRVDDSGKPSPQYLKEDGSEYDYIRGGGGAMNVKVVAVSPEATGIPVQLDATQNHVQVFVGDKLYGQGVTQQLEMLSGKVAVQNPCYRRLLIEGDGNSYLGVTITKGDKTIYQSDTPLYSADLGGPEIPLLLGNFDVQFNGCVTTSQTNGHYSW